MNCDQPGGLPHLENRKNISQLRPNYTPQDSAIVLLGRNYTPNGSAKALLRIDYTPQDSVKGHIFIGNKLDNSAIAPQRINYTLEDSLIAHLFLFTSLTTPQNRQSDKNTSWMTPQSHYVMLKLAKNFLNFRQFC